MRCETCHGTGRIAIMPTKLDGSIYGGSSMPIHPITVLCHACSGSGQQANTHSSSEMDDEKTADQKTDEM